MNAFAERLISSRKKCGLTQSDVAEKLEVSFQEVSLWERGEKSPEIGKLAELSAMLHVTTDWLLTGKESREYYFGVEENSSERFINEERIYDYIKNYATTHNMLDTLKALPFAKEKHEGQYRKGKELVPYIYHPLLVACHALALGLNEDALIAAALLHDVCEDCGVLPEELPVSAEAKEVIVLLTKDDSPAGRTKAGKEKYFRGIAGNRMAIMIKLLDRCHNVSGMGLSFTSERMAKYIRETEEWIYPLFDEAKKNYSEYAGQLFILEYHIFSIISALKKQLSVPFEIFMN